MRVTSNDLQKQLEQQNTTRGLSLPQVASTTFTAPAYTAATRETKPGKTSGLWSAMCFVGGTLFGFRGRVSRLDYWISGSAYTVTSIIGYIAFAQAAGSFNWGDIASASHDIGFLLRFLTFCFVMMMLRFSLEARRFQDRGVTGYWYFGYLVPFLNIYLLLANSLMPGTKGANRYDL